MYPYQNQNGNGLPYNGIHFNQQNGQFGQNNAQNSVQQPPFVSAGFPNNGFSQFQSNATLEGFTFPEVNAQQLYYPTKLEPYRDEQFLYKTFNFRIPYIEAFLSLSHEEKLKFYLMVEERKLTGKFSDQRQYKAYLSKIRLIVNPELNKKEDRIGLTDDEIRKQILERDVDKFCEEEFKRLDVHINELRDSESHEAASKAINEVEPLYRMYEEPKKEEDQQKALEADSGQDQFGDYEQEERQSQNLRIEDTQAKVILGQKVNDLSQEDDQWNEASVSVENEAHNNSQEAEKNLNQAASELQQTVKVSSSHQQQAQHNYSAQKEQASEDEEWNDAEVESQPMNEDDGQCRVTQNSKNGALVSEIKPRLPSENQCQPNSTTDTENVSSIWDLELNEEELKANEPNIKSILFNKKDIDRILAENILFDSTLPSEPKGQHQLKPMCEEPQAQGKQFDYLDLLGGQTVQERSEVSGESQYWTQNESELSNSLKPQGTENEQNQQRIEPYAQNNNALNFTVQFPVVEADFTKREKIESAEQEPEDEEWEDGQFAEDFQAQSVNDQSVAFDSQNLAAVQQLPKQGMSLSGETAEIEKGAAQREQKDDEEQDEWEEAEQQQNPCSPAVQQLDPEHQQFQWQTFQKEAQSTPSVNPGTEPISQLQQHHPQGHSLHFQMSQPQVANQIPLIKESAQGNQAMGTEIEQREPKTKSSIHNTVNAKSENMIKQSESKIVSTYQRFKSRMLSHKQQQNSWNRGMKNGEVFLDDQENSGCQTQKRSSNRSLEEEGGTQMGADIDVSQGLNRTSNINFMKKPRSQVSEHLQTNPKYHKIDNALSIKLLSRDEFSQLEKLIQEKAGFEFNPRVYEIMLRGLEQMHKIHPSLFDEIRVLRQKHHCSSEQEVFLTTQVQKLNQLSVLNNKYSEAVEEEQEEELAETLLQTKQICFDITAQAERCQRIFDRVFNRKMHENKSGNRGVFYQMGKLLIDRLQSQNGEDSPSKLQNLQFAVDRFVAMYRHDPNSDENKKEVFELGAVLHVLTELHQLSYLKNIASYLVDYMSDQHQTLMKTLDSIKDLSRDHSLPATEIFSKLMRTEQSQSNEFLEYLKGLSMMAKITERVLKIAKIIGLRLQNLNFLKFSKLLKDCQTLCDKYHLLGQEQSQWSETCSQHSSSSAIGLLPKKYLDHFLEICFFQQQHSPKRIEESVCEILSESPLCKMCLIPRQGESDQSGSWLQQQGASNRLRWCHYRCYNILKIAFLKDSKQQQKQTQQENDEFDEFI